ncbi:PspA/IM30 family protein [Anabaena cylindrica FACHB-243]|uniref:Phage shock protein A (PspA) family protein n=1 Tax=Anabaena cylindrica (strain ATCC 27899 / PCC 7122) TaxID=272123 RepID=K9ZFB9_ANACC|nr:MULTISPECIES: PspA/IM30 family protein [Anabaena]AFZ57055.1 phage shock protein A (PspA) family protein [Anabaena cylindrica PCC 7122]MBD2421473.1 PspA/IM30 family protein [Anabaena cylindrica FACHB-243]MBY5285755.1 PspA/IM30 family protein [Anabaena sp. CCAP 1446/1C]MBY5309809.1 PspA/IM30 family protein [Anabaena sp. CCAP 1446/1C]MCM2407766.1 PspA/IM30 family protein [Anabaena sp. CCAP 1446/1C]
MEVMKRILRVIRSNLNDLVNGAEDPEKVMERAFLEMQENLVQLRQGVACAIATQKRTERQAIAAQSQVEEWYRRAQLALQQGNESLAREALTKRQAYQETSASLSLQMDQQQVVVGKLKQDMRTLELKIVEVKTKKDMYIARARSAQASYKLQEMLSGVSATTSLSAWERMEEKVLQMEAQTEVIAQLSSDDLETRFAKLKSSNNIDAELTAMKTQMLGEVDQKT